MRSLDYHHVFYYMYLSKMIERRSEFTSVGSLHATSPSFNLFPIRETDFIHLYLSPILSNFLSFVAINEYKCSVRKLCMYR